MNQPIFDTKQRAAELLETAIRIWRQSDNAEILEGIENDPVFNMLLTALAYRENEIDSDIERLTKEVTEEFANLFIPFEAGHAIPATALIETLPYPSLSEVELNESTVFKLEGQFNFIPLFKSKVINAIINDLERIDGRRWKVNLKLRHPINDLGGFCFAIKDSDFRNLTVSMKNKKLRLIRPWNYADLPFVSCFGIDSLTYNQGEQFSPSSLPLDLFAKQNIRLYWIENTEESNLEDGKTDIELLFEFNGIKESFSFDSSKILLNAVLLTNVSVKDTTLSNSHPISRLTGFSANDNNASSPHEQFLNLVNLSPEFFSGRNDLELRRINADRFNQGSLLKLLTSLVNKYHSDFYAFQNLEGANSERLILILQESIKKLIELSQKDLNRNISGTYVLIKNKKGLKENLSIKVKYLVTSGKAVNQFLTKDSRFSTPPNIEETSTRQISYPTQGYDEINNDDLSKSQLRYYLLTSDRIVTPADIKLFCLVQLQRLYSLGKDFVKEIKITHRKSTDNYGIGYEIFVDISLLSTPTVKRSLGEKIQTIEILLQKMMEVRSASVYPFRVNIRLSE